MDAFQPSSLLIVRAGDGVATYTTNYAALFIDEVNPAAGTVVQSIPLPTVTVGSNYRCVAPFNATTPTEAIPTLTYDGTAVLVACSDAQLGFGWSWTPPSGGRVVAVVTADGRVNTATHVLGWNGAGGTPSGPGYFRSATAYNLSGPVYLVGYQAGTCELGRE